VRSFPTFHLIPCVECLLHVSFSGFLHVVCLLNLGVSPGLHSSLNLGVSPGLHASSGLGVSHGLYASLDLGVSPGLHASLDLESSRFS